MLDLLNTKGGMIVAGAVAALIFAFLVYVGIVFHVALGWMGFAEICMLFVLLNVAITVALLRWHHAPHVVRDKKDAPVRVVDGQALELPTYPAGLTTLTLHYDPRTNIKNEPAIGPAMVDARPALPAAKSIYEIAGAMHDADKVLLGYDERGPIWLEIDDLLSIAMAGNSGRGKSRALLWLVLQFLRLKVETVIIDGKADLRKWLGSYHPVAYTGAEIQRVVDEGIYEIEQRLEMDSQGIGMEFPPKLFIIDELDLVAGRSAGVTKLIELLTKKSRSVNVHGVYSNQSVPADLLGGVKTRGVIVSRICFYCDDEAARLIGVRKDNGGAELLQRIGPPESEGLAVARTARFGWKLVAFPYVPDTAISFMLEGLNPLRPLPMKTQPTDPYAALYGYPFGLPNDEKTAVTGSSLSVLAPPERPKTAPTRPKALTSKERERERIMQALKDNPGASASAICALLGISNNKVALVKRIKQEEGIIS